MCGSCCGSRSRADPCSCQRTNGFSVTTFRWSRCHGPQRGKSGGTNSATRADRVRRLKTSKPLRTLMRNGRRNRASGRTRHDRAAPRSRRCAAGRKSRTRSRSDSMERVELLTELNSAKARACLRRARDHLHRQAIDRSRSRGAQIRGWWMRARSALPTWRGIAVGFTAGQKSRSVDHGYALRPRPVRTVLMFVLVQSAGVHLARFVKFRHSGVNRLPASGPHPQPESSGVCRSVPHVGSVAVRRVSPICSSWARPSISKRRSRDGSHGRSI